jgi:hypothetical protein
MGRAIPILLAILQWSHGPTSSIPTVFLSLPQFGTKTGSGQAHLNLKIMNGLLNIIIILLVVGWLIGYVGYGAMVGSLIHILLVLAVIGILYRLFTGRRANI